MLVHHLNLKGKGVWLNLIKWKLKRIAGIKWRTIKLFSEECFNVDIMIENIVEQNNCSRMKNELQKQTPGGLLWANNGPGTVLVNITNTVEIFSHACKINS